MVWKKIYNSSQDFLFELKLGHMLLGSLGYLSAKLQLKIRKSIFKAKPVSSRKILKIALYLGEEALDNCRIWCAIPNF